MDIKFALNVIILTKIILFIMVKYIVINNAAVGIIVVGKFAGPWVIEDATARRASGLGPDTEAYVIRSIPQNKILVMYYVPIGWKRNFYWSVYDDELRSLCENFEPCNNPSQFSPTGGFVDTKTEAREILEAVLKAAEYKLTDSKFSILT